MLDLRFVMPDLGTKQVVRPSMERDGKDHFSTGHEHARTFREGLAKIRDMLDDLQ